VSPKPSASRERVRAGRGYTPVGSGSWATSSVGLFKDEMFPPCVVNASAAIRSEQVQPRCTLYAKKMDSSN